MKVHHNAQELIHWLREHQPATVAQIAANGVMNSRDASDAPRADLLKAVQRFRDGDLGGAISAACGAVDNAVVSVLGVLGRSFQEGCNRALATVGLETPLGELDWDAEALKLFASNFRGSLNQGAYVMQTLRSKMGEVHGTKPVLKPLVFDALKWAGLCQVAAATAVE